MQTDDRDAAAGAARAERYEQLFGTLEGELETLTGSVTTELHERFHELRAERPVHEGSLYDVFGLPGMHTAMGPAIATGALSPSTRSFVALSYDTCELAFRHPEVFSSTIFEPASRTLVGDNLLGMDGDDHRRLRALVQPAFSIGRTDWWSRNWVGGLVDELVAGFEGSGHADLNLELCARLPLRVITASFGIAEDEALEVRELISQIFFSPSLAFDERIARSEALAGIIRPHMAARRREPRDDLLSVLVHSEVTEPDGSRSLLTDAEIIGFARLLLTAGSGTTWRQLAITLVALLGDADVLAEVRDDRRLLRSVIEETLRWEVTDPAFLRLVLTDVELGGVHLPAGSVLEVIASAANRDPERWDDPDRWDPRRPSRPHLAFGTGPHVCLGMHVARQEIGLSVSALLDRIPDVRLDPARAVPVIAGLEHRGPGAVPVVFTPR